MTKKKPAAKKAPARTERVAPPAANKGKTKTQTKPAAKGAAQRAPVAAAVKSPGAGAPPVPAASADPAAWRAGLFRARRAAGELSAADAGQRAALCGWAFRYRDQGGCVFVDLRDRSGLIQLVFDRSELADQYAAAERIRAEFVIGVTGLVRKRTPENVNPKLKTGAIEVLVERFEILSRAETPPFNLDEFSHIHEDVRLKYRYLDMRREDLAHALAKRSHLSQAIRRFLENDGFLEVETPVLNKSTPEGARDFLTPSRLQPGKFYALPQSPQLFKQILMVGGVERYFQIVKCFRDEDLRADRQPEFTQLDLEMSFVDENIIMDAMERLWSSVAREVFNVEVSTPIRRMNYRDAMEYYGVDKPDLRFEMPLADAAAIVRKSEFKVFHAALDAGGRVKALRVPGGAKLSRKDIDDLTAWVGEAYGAQGLAWLKHEANGLHSNIAKFFGPDLLAELARILGSKEGDMVFFGAGREDIVNASLGNLRVRLARDLGMIPENAFSFVWVTDFPLFELDHKTGQLLSMHHPFTSSHPDDLPILADPARFKKEATQIRSRAYDLVLNGVEIGGGSVRIHDTEVQKVVFRALGISEEQAEARFGFFLEALKYGAPPHGGIAFGLDRVLMLFLGRESIRDVMAFPKTQKGQCLMSEAPSGVEPEQLRELKIRSLVQENV